MDVRFYLEQLFEQEPLKEEPIVTQEKNKAQEEVNLFKLERKGVFKRRRTHFGSCGGNEKKGIISDPKKKEVALKPILEVMPLLSLKHTLTPSIGLIWKLR